MDRIIGKMGMLPTKHDPRTLRLENYLDAAVNLPPLLPKVDYNIKVKKRQMYANDKYGCCVIAGIANAIQTWTANAGREVILTDKQIIDTYFKLTGGPDSGLYLLDTLKAWTKNMDLFWGHPLGAFVAFDPQNIRSWRYVTELGGVVYAGYSLPLAAQKQFKASKPWSPPASGDLTGDNEPGGWGGHCMTSAHFENFGSNLDTWKVLQPATKSWIMDYCDEAYWLVALDWFDKSHHTPMGLHWSELLKDLKVATGK